LGVSGDAIYSKREKIIFFTSALRVYSYYYL